MEIQHIELHQNEGHFDLSLEMIETEKTISACLRYKSDIFKRETIKKMTENYLVLLEEVTTDSGLKISKLSPPLVKRKK